MQTIGVICEYNPIHLGHANHLIKSKKKLGGQCAIICVMSGNYVQRGDLAVFNKHARAQATVHAGADLVVELPTPYALSSAEGFARAGVYILDMMGICDYICFGSESGEIETLKEAAEIILTAPAEALLKKWLGKGLSYASALQKTADEVLHHKSDVFKTPNNVLGIEYLKALNFYGSDVKPITVTRSGGAHDCDKGFSASRLRKMLKNGKQPWVLTPSVSSKVFKNEIENGRGPVFISNVESAILSRLRMIEDFSKLPNVSEGIERRFMRYAHFEPTVSDILEKVKTKRYPMSRIRRMLICACLGITADDTALPPPYIKVLAMTQLGAKLLKMARDKSKLPIITKPASGKNLSDRAVQLLKKEASATDFYALAYPDADKRRAGQEWKTSPYVAK